MAADVIDTHCRCPYDYAGDCKHIVAVLLAVDDRDIDADAASTDESTENRPDSVDVESGTSNDSGADISSSLRTRALVSTCAYLLEELDEEEALLGLYEETYLESSQFCNTYAQRLLDRGDDSGFDWDADVRDRLRTIVEDCGLAQQLPDKWTFADVVM